MLPFRMITLDHIVYCVQDLESSIEHISDTLGIAPRFGGFHKTKGTKNALLDLGDETYLELLAIDEGNHNVSVPRWMGIDLISTPRITRWAVKSNSLLRDIVRLKSVAPQLGEIEEGQRTTGDNRSIKWQLSRPLPIPEVELLPFFIAWDTKEKHPTTFLDKGCSLKAFYATHPDPVLVHGILEKIGVDLELKQWNTISIHATIEGPKGSISI